MRYPPLPSKVGEVFERETLGLDPRLGFGAQGGGDAGFWGGFCQVRQTVLRRVLGMVAVCGFLLVVGCAPPRSSRITIGAKNFTEQVVLGELLAQEIEAVTGEEVARRFYLAGSYLCQQALVSGRIDGYVEYTGTALTAILKQPLPPVGQREETAVYKW
jgi:osmoprotectant transport system substrate-binding protein